MSETVLDRLIVSIGMALANNANAFAEPVALLWPDEGRQWEAVMARVRDRLPVVTLGNHDRDARQGPAYWLRCVVAGTVDGGLPEGRPILYLPGVARSELRAVDSCPPQLAPIAELQYRSQWFSHPNSRDWTVRALLSNAERGLGLSIAEDPETHAALSLALSRLLDQQIDPLSRQLLDADYLNELVNPDPVNSLLNWLDDPVGFRARLGDTQWLAFLQQCSADYGFDPDGDGVITAAGKLAGRDGPWAHVWKRFADTPDRFTGVPERLRQAKPMELPFEHSDVWPQDAEIGEEQLRARLLDFEVLTADGARTEAMTLEAEHGWRRGTVWADLGLTPLAFAIEQLTLLAELTAKEGLSQDLNSLREHHEEWGWRADDAALRALAIARSPADRAAVSAALIAMYRPWLNMTATAMQAAVGSLANTHTYEPGPVAAAASGSVLLFVDGLRLDLAHRVTERLAGGGVQVQASTSLAALPTVTQTAKPALMPVAKGALSAGPDLHARNSVTGTQATIAVLRSLMVDEGVEVLGPTETGDPTGSAWSEAGEVDHRGHDVGVRLVDYLDEEIDRIAERVRELIEAGWQRVEVVTDHGWILLPGGLEKLDLPLATTHIKKGRCARLKEGAVVDVPTVPWFWDQDVRIGLAPGVTCFEAGKEYEHGGISPQECIVPRLSVTRGEAEVVTGGPQISKVTWLGLLCRIELSGAGQGVLVDLRGLPGDPTTSIAEEAKETRSRSRVSLLVPDEEHEGHQAHLVLVGADGQVVAQREVVVGKNR